MCLGIPGKVTSTYQEHDVLMGKVDFGGVFTDSPFHAVHAFGEALGLGAGAATGTGAGAGGRGV